MQAPSAPRAWLAAIRPRTLGAAIAPVIAGTGFAARYWRLHPLAALGALGGALLLQIGTNLANDYADFKSGADDDQRLGPPRATQQGWIAPRQVALGAALAFGLAALVGIYLVVRGGWPIAVVGIAGVICGITYTAGPWPFGYHGLGDLVVFVFFGPVAVCGTFYVQTRELRAAPALGSIGVGALITAILVVNNIRDRDSDARAGKRTLAVRLGLRASRVEYGALIALPYLVLPLAPLLGLGGWGWLLPLFHLPFAIVELRRVWQSDGAALNPSLGYTARLALHYSVLLAIGVCL